MSLKIQYASDLHIEFPQNREFLKLHSLQTAGEILILAGDIVPFTVIDKHKDFFNYLSDHFKLTYWLPGNHEYYHFDIAEKSGEVNEKIKSNVFLVNNISKVHDNTKLIFSTLWSKISPGHQWQIERSLNDFRLIKYNGHRFSADRFNQLHEECLTFIENELNETLTENTVVISHHCPTFLNYPEQYKGDLLNEAFAVELYDLILSSKIDYWAFGHHHCNVSEFSIGNTRLVTNQLGYVQRNEHGGFETDKRIHF